MQNKINSSLKNILLLFFFILSHHCFSVIPILNTNPAITDKVIYLDFDGQKVYGTFWNSGALINAAPSTMSAANINEIWKRMREDYRPFDVNITTDSVRFNNAVPNKRMRVIVTPTSAWYPSAGGVAYVGSFAWGGSSGTPCWVFENQLGYNPKNIAEAAAHEAGHTLTLYHQSYYDNQCNKTEYNPGTGSGVTSWAPIMGVGYSKNVTIWHTGTSATSCTTIQHDIGNTGIGITSPGYLTFLLDDVGDLYSTAKIMNLNSLTTLDSGLISQPTDIDAYQFTICNNRYVSISAKPWALDTVNYSGADLDIRLSLFNSSNSLIGTDTSLTKLDARVGFNLTPGSYYFTIDGGRSSNYTDYGSLGKYFLSIKATNPPALANTILSNSNICSGQGTILNYNSNGIPTNWQWSITGSSTTTFSTQNPSFIFNPPGVYTISLLATSASSLSCPTTITLNVGSPPSLSVSNPNILLCNSKTTTLSASGASVYSWIPGNYGGSNQIVGPSITTAYTITGNNGTCSNSVVTTVTVSPNFSITVVPSSTLVCFGDSTILTASGATSYTFDPGGVTTNPAVFVPTANISYTITGMNGTCFNTKIKNVTVYPAFSASLVVSSNSICAGKTAYFAGSDPNTYTVNPGGITANPAVISPIVTTNYTITVGSGNVCFQDTIVNIVVSPCDFVGISAYIEDADLLIYPNPASSNITIESSETYNTIEVIDALGNMMFEKISNDQKKSVIVTNDWAKGIYFIKLYSAQNAVQIRKLVID